MNDREQILSRIREGLGPHSGKDPSPPSPPPHAETDPGPKQDQETLIRTFEKECEAVDCRIYRAEDELALGACLESIVDGSGVKKAVRWRSSLLDAWHMDRHLQRLGVRIFRPGQEQETRDNNPLEWLEEAELGITGADFALADTGTLVLKSLPGRNRSFSLLPPVHVALLEPDRILPGLDDLIYRLSKDIQDHGTMESCVTLITGPSKTADIEMILVNGVHGPREVHVILVENPSS
jgi:L-lactate dehydrogenase complex protein LldG